MSCETEEEIGEAPNTGSDVAAGAEPASFEGLAFVEAGGVFDAGLGEGVLFGGGLFEKGGSRRARASSGAANT